MNRKEQLRTCLRCKESYPLHMARCPFCREYHGHGKRRNRLVMLSDIEATDEERYRTGPWDAAWGGGIVPGTTTLLGGPPGIGKSTLVMQILQQFEMSVIVSAEESPGEIKRRADRLQIDQEGIAIHDAMGDSTPFHEILQSLGTSPCIVAFDSLQALGNGNEVDTMEILRTIRAWTAATGIPAIIISHATKEDSFAGLLTFQHDVTATIEFMMHPDAEKDPDAADTRILMARKNRHGPGGASAILRMGARGLVDAGEEPGQPEPGRPEPGQPEPGQPEPGQPEPGQPEHVAGIIHRE